MEIFDIHKSFLGKKLENLLLFLKDLKPRLFSFFDIHLISCFSPLFRLIELSYITFLTLPAGHACPR